MPGDKKEKGKVGEFLKYCENFEKAIGSVDSFEKDLSKGIKETIGTMNLEDILNYSDKDFFKDFKGGLKEVFEKCFKKTLKEKKKRSQTKEVLEDIIEKIEKSEKIENLEGVFGLDKFTKNLKRGIKSRICDDEVKKNFESFVKDVQTLFKNYGKVLELKYTDKLDKIREKVETLIQNANSNVNELKKSVSKRLEKLGKLSELAKKIEKPSNNTKRALFSADQVLRSNVLKQIDETSGIGAQIDRMIPNISENLKEINKYIKNGKIDEAITLRDNVASNVDNASEECDKMSLNIGGAKSLCFGTATSLRKKLDGIESRLRELDDELDDYGHKKEIENGINYEDGILNISDDVTEICEDDIDKKWKTNIKEVNFEGKNTEISESVFSGCNKLETVTLPSAITEISEKAFYGCSKLKEIKLPNVKTIGESAFFGCSSLKKITFPASVERISKKAFDGCTSLTKVTFKGDIPKIEKNAFPEKLREIKCKEVSEERMELIRDAIENSDLEFV